jgi:hypothetical protein
MHSIYLVTYNSRMVRWTTNIAFATVRSGFILPMYGPSTGHALVCLIEINSSCLPGPLYHTLAYFGQLFAQ